MNKTILLKTTLPLLLLLLTGTVAAVQDVKRPEEVFRFETSFADNKLIVDWDIEDGYYLYRDKMGFASSTEGVSLGNPLFPEGEIHSDEFFGEQVVFRGKARVVIPVLSKPAGTRRIELDVKSQGCADFGLCYPPQTWQAKVKTPSDPVFDLRPALPLPKRSDEPLPIDQAFRGSVEVVDAFTLAVTWVIEPGYYLYKNSFSFAAPGADVQLGTPQYPEGIVVDDLEYGITEVYYDELIIRLPLSRASRDEHPIALEVAYQGCKEDSICYPPDVLIANIVLPQASADDFVDQRAPQSEQSRLMGIVSDAGLPTIMSIFLGVGLLLAFTPCCLPMVPILSGIIAGQGNSVTTMRAFLLSLSYVLGMAFTYTIAGAVFGAAGTQIQAALQTPLVIGAVTALFVVLALAMFGAYELQMPAAIQTRLTAIGNNQKAGSFIGVAVMGAVSALVVSTCVAPPLVAALTVIAQTGDVARGALALFSMAIGMGIPLLIIGTSAGKLLPKAGPWMNTIKAVFGFMMLALAVWMVSRLIDGTIIMALYAALAIAAAIRFGVFSALPQSAGALQLLGKGAAIVLLIYGGTLVVGVISGSTNPLQPLDRLTGTEVTHLEFEQIKSVDDFEAARARAAAAGVPLMLDFYADWCVSCKEMEYYTFTDPQVQARLAEAILVQADVTANDAIDQALLAHFGIFGPPTIVFHDRAGKEIPDTRVIGYMATDEFLEHLNYVLR